MKKLIAIVSSLFLVTTISVKAEMGIGISGAYHMLDGSGTETTRQSGQKNDGNHSEDILVPELFIEAIGDNGSAFGISYISTRDLGSRARTDAESPGDTDSDDGTYTAKAEFEDVFKIYGDIPISSFMGTTYLHVGVQHVTLATLESISTSGGTSYPNEDLLGATIGLGVKGDIPYGNNYYYKAEVTYTDFEDYEGKSSSGNQISADLDDTAVRLSIGYKF